MRRAEGTNPDGLKPGLVGVVDLQNRLGAGRVDNDSLQGLGEALSASHGPRLGGGRRPERSADAESIHAASTLPPRVITRERISLGEIQSRVTRRVAQT